MYGKISVICKITAKENNRLSQNVYVYPTFGRNWCFLCCI